MRPVIPLTTTVVALAVSGCGGSGGTHTVASHTPTTTAQPNTPAALEQAVRTAILANNRLSTYVLGRNAVPGWASMSTGGPALAQLRSSAAARASSGVHVRLLSAKYQVLSVQLDPSYTTATALISDRGKVREYQSGQAGRTSSFDEHARLQLHRVGNSQRFVVWKLVAAS